MMSQDFAGQKLIVVGSTSGIGQAAAQLVLERGALLFSLVTVPKNCKQQWLNSMHLVLCLGITLTFAIPKNEPP